MENLQELLRNAGTLKQAFEVLKENSLKIAIAHDDTYHEITEVKEDYLVFPLTPGQLEHASLNKDYRLLGMLHPIASDIIYYVNGY